MGSVGEGVDFTKSSQEVSVGCSNFSVKGGRPRGEGWGSKKVSVVIDICWEEMGKGELGTAAEEEKGSVFVWERG